MPQIYLTHICTEEKIVHVLAKDSRLVHQKAHSITIIKLWNVNDITKDHTGYINRNLIFHCALRLAVAYFLSDIIFAI